MVLTAMMMQTEMSSKARHILYVSKARCVGGGEGTDMKGDSLLLVGIRFNYFFKMYLLLGSSHIVGKITIFTAWLCGAWAGLPCLLPPLLALLTQRKQTVLVCGPGDCRATEHAAFSLLNNQTR